MVLFFFFSESGLPFPSSHLLWLTSFIAVPNYFIMSSIVFWLNPKQWQKVNNKNLRPCLPLRNRIRQSCLHTLCGPDIDPISSCLLILTWNRFRFADYFVLTPCRLLSRGSCSVITSCSGCRSCRGRKTCFAFRRPELLVKEPFETSRTGGMARWWGGGVTAVGTGLLVGVMKMSSGWWWGWMCSSERSKNHWMVHFKCVNCIKAAFFKKRHPDSTFTQ